MKSIQNYEVLSNEYLALDIYKMVLKGDSSWITNPGQFVNITIENAYLKRPISICDWDDNSITIIYKVVGFGTKQLSQRKVGDVVEIKFGDKVSRFEILKIPTTQGKGLEEIIKLL